MLDIVKKAHDYFSSKRKKSVVSSRSGFSEVQGAFATRPKASLLDLPPELRDHIYLYTASSTTLFLPPTSPRRRPPPVGLLLVCRQTYREYRFILLAFATIVFQISGFDFSNAIRVLRKQDAGSKTALSKDTDLWILLLVSHVPIRDHRIGLATWCEYRPELSSWVDVDTNATQSTSAITLRHPVTFQYDVKFLPGMRPPRPPIRYANGYEMQLDLLRAHLRMIMDIRVIMGFNDEEADELRRMHRDLLKKAEVLEHLARPNG